MDPLMERARRAFRSGDLAAAETALLARLNEDFHDAEALLWLGAVHLQQGHNGAAVALFRQVISLDPSCSDALNNIGVAYKAENRHDMAESLWRLALEQRADAQIWCNLASLYVNEGCPEKAIAAAEEALVLEPGHAGAIWNRGLARLEQGDWAAGWADYDAGIRHGKRVDRVYPGVPDLWDGRPDQRVVLWGEQGLGDEILFASMLPDAIARSAAVTLDCHPRLATLFRRAFPITVHGTRKSDEVPWAETLTADARASLASLGGMFRRCDADFPGTPYLKADQTAAAALRARGDGRLRVGIAWAGGSKKTRADYRSIPLPLWRPILDQDVELISLQYTDDAAQTLHDLAWETGIRIHHPPQIRAFDYDETASLVASLDLVIAVCTSVVHLAGALGVPCLCLVPAKPAWRYGLRGEAMPWYNSVRLFRQAPDTGWAPVIDRVASVLRDRLS